MLVAYDVEQVVSADKLNEGWVLDGRDAADVSEWADLMGALAPYLDRCVFLVVPGKFGDPEESLLLWRALAPLAIDFGFPVAFVSQFDAVPADVPWEELDVLLTDDAALRAYAIERDLQVYPADLNYRTVYLE